MDIVTEDNNNLNHLDEYNLTICLKRDLFKKLEKVALLRNLTLESLVIEDLKSLITLWREKLQQIDIEL